MKKAWNKALLFSKPTNKLYPPPPCVSGRRVRPFLIAMASSLSNFILFLQKPQGKSGENLKLEPLRREPFSVEDLQRNLPPPPSLNSPEFQSVAQRLHNTKMLKHQSRFNVNPRSPDINYHYKMPSSASKDSVSVGGHLYKF